MTNKLSEECGDEDCYTMNRVIIEAAKAIMLTVYLNGKPLKMEIDSGSGCSFISDKTLKSLWSVKGPKITMTKKRIKIWSKQKLKTVGTTDVEVQWKNCKISLSRVVVKRVEASLLGEIGFTLLESPSTERTSNLSRTSSDCGNSHNPSNNITADWTVSYDTGILEGGGYRCHVDYLRTPVDTSEEKIQGKENKEDKRKEGTEVRSPEEAKVADGNTERITFTDGPDGHCPMRRKCRPKYSEKYICKI
ncbi:hypothetical protein T4E_6609 [Trichinella pseudospiralis]|uniref:Uncharacterized protein n=1 Tax=Trichinella pseudospiralis TaxID=6337 RepID=A0A0V0Y611_TRIPS|nr:hypothetical protein T4E_6609 [Trichinella pseudospiralis]